MDVLGRMIDRAREAEALRGFFIGKDRVVVTHLQFADDTPLLLDGPGTYVQVARKLVDCFCRISGLLLNVDKSLIAGVNVEHDMISSIERRLGCNVGNWPITYLGMPLGGDPLKKEFWSMVLKKIARRLDSWKRRFLCKRGRLMLIKDILAVVPTFFMSLFRVPIAVANFIEAKMRNFY